MKDREHRAERSGARCRDQPGGLGGFPPQKLRLVLALLLGACGSAPSTPARTPAARTESRPLPLWAIESPTGQQSHILGTHHLGVRIEEVVPAPHIEALDRARVLLVEMSIDDLDTAALMQTALLPEGQDLERLLPPATWTRLVAALARAVPEPVLHRMQPWAAMSAVVAADASRLEGERTQSGSEGAPSMLDVQVMQRARARRVRIVGLETTAEQGALMQSIPLASVVEYIEAALNGDDDEGPTLRELTHAYLRGDLRELETMVFDPDEIARSPQVFETLVYQRNERWLDRVERELAQGRAFVAVGLAHVIGERGLLRLLEQRGYRIRRLSTGR